MSNPVAKSIAPLMVVAASVDMKGFLLAVAAALDEARHDDIAQAVRDILEDEGDTDAAVN